MTAQVKVIEPDVVQPRIWPLAGKKLKVAIVHDWLEVYAGAEKVLEQIIQLWPDADVFTLVDFLPEKQRKFLGHCKVHTSSLQHWPSSSLICLATTW
jgi:hypothetical protein